jgi:hypothetical protein
VSGRQGFNELRKTMGYAEFRDLAQRRRAAFWMLVQCGLSYADVGRLMGESAQVARSNASRYEAQLVHRAKAYLGGRNRASKEPAYIARLRQAGAIARDPFPRRAFPRLISNPRKTDAAPPSGVPPASVE